MDPHDLDRTIVDHINEKAKLLEAQLGSDVVCYSGQIHPQYYRPFRNFIEEVQETSESKSKTLSIVLRTPGGSAETVERYVTVVRKHYDTVNFIVPDMAMSAGTIWCMSGDKIFMDYSSSLGPIDPQVLASDNSGYVAALGYLDKVKQITEQEQLSQADVVFLKSLDLAKLALYEQARDLSVDLLKKWLVQYKFKNWALHRTNAPGTVVTIEQKEFRAEEIAKDLADHKKWRSHGRALNIEKLKELRLEIDDYSDNITLGNAIRAYNDLLTAYNDRMGQKFYLHSHLVKDSI